MNLIWSREGMCSTYTYLYSNFVLYISLLLTCFYKNFFSFLPIRYQFLFIFLKSGERWTYDASLEKFSLVKWQHPIWLLSIHLEEPVNCFALAINNPVTHKKETLNPWKGNTNLATLPHCFAWKWNIKNMFGMRYLTLSSSFVVYLFRTSLYLFIFCGILMLLAWACFALFMYFDIF